PDAAAHPRSLHAALLRARERGCGARLVEGARRPRAHQVGNRRARLRRADSRGVRRRVEPHEAVMVNAFSVDVEDWYQVSDFEELVEFAAWERYESRVVNNTERVLALLAEHHVKATFFVLTWNAERHPEVVRRIADAGHEVASHGYRHRLIYE